VEVDKILGPNGAMEAFVAAQKAGEGAVPSPESRMRNVLKSKMWPSRFKPLCGKLFFLNFAT